MILSIWTGLGFGMGFVFGIILGILILFILYKILKGKKKNEVGQEPFTVEIFEVYRKKLVDNEKFEEIRKIDEIIGYLKDNKYPTTLLVDYGIEKDFDLDLNNKEGGGTRISLNKKFKVVRKKTKK